MEPETFLAPEIAELAGVANGSVGMAKAVQQLLIDAAEPRRCSGLPTKPLSRASKTVAVSKTVSPTKPLSLLLPPPVQRRPKVMMNLLLQCPQNSPLVGSARVHRGFGSGTATALDLGITVRGGADGIFDRRQRHLKTFQEERNSKRQALSTKRRLQLSQASSENVNGEEE